MAKSPSGIDKVRVQARHEANKYSKSQANSYVKDKLRDGAYFGSEVDRLAFEYLCARIGVQVDWVRHDLNAGWTLPVKEEKVGKERPAKRESIGAQSGQGGWWTENDGREGSSDGGRYA
jgi:hypothetical protein